MSKQKFLIVQLGNYGDCLYATVIAKQLKKDYVNCHITWAIASKYKSILHLNPYVDCIWEQPMANKDFHNHKWRVFIEEIKQRENSRFDEIIISQIPPDNWKYFYFSIRNTILSRYKRRITTSLTPVVRLDEEEVERVKEFATRNNLNKYREVILFECMPGSGQSKVDVDFAVEVSKKITSQNKDVCMLITSAEKNDFDNPQIIDASELSFRENAELTKYCSFIIGCSSGITWLSTSDWAKKNPMLQLLDKNIGYFVGVDFELKANKIVDYEVIEMLEYDVDKVVACLGKLVYGEFREAKKHFHEVYKPSSDNLIWHIQVLVNRDFSTFSIIKFARNFIKTNLKYDNKIKFRFFSFLYLLFSLKYQKTNKFTFKVLRKVLVKLK